MNPGEVDAARLRRCASAGVNRLSIGVQALEDGCLRGARAATTTPPPVRPPCARRAPPGSTTSRSISMFGVPGQTLDDWRRAVDAAVALAPEHVSAYALTIERGTAFGSRDRAGRLARPDDEAVAAMFEHARAAFAAAGLPPTRSPATRARGHRARHNQPLLGAGARTWGVGASAASFRPLADGAGWRFSNPRATDIYLTAATGAGARSAPRRATQRRTTWRTRRSGWACAPSTGSIARRIRRATGAIRSTGRERPAVAWAEQPGGWWSTRPAFD